MRRLALLLVLIAAAPAAAQRLPTFAEDRKGDVAGRFDVVRVALGKRSEATLRGEITMARSWTVAQARGTSICLRLYTRRDPESDPPDFLVCAIAPREGETMTGRVLRDRANGLPRTVADATISRPTGRTVYLRFAVADIGSPAAVRFGAETVRRGTGCSEPLGCRDTAPDAPKTMRLALAR